MRRRDALTVIDVAVGVIAIGAGVVGATKGFSRYGVVGAVLGFPVGVVAGVIAGVVLLVAMALVLFVAVVVWVLFTDGLSGVREMFCDAPPDDADSTTVGECHGDGK